LHGEVAELEAKTGTKVFTAALERHQVMKGDDGRDGGTQRRAVQPRGMEDAAASGSVRLDDLAPRIGPQSGEQAARVSPDAVRLPCRAAIEGDPHEGGSSHLADAGVG
jgi:hypothetical protein